MSRTGKFLGATAALIALGGAYTFAPHAFAQAAGVYTSAQAEAGHAAYAASCAGCHRANLAGGGDAPAHEKFFLEISPVSGGGICAIVIHQVDRIDSLFCLERWQGRHLRADAHDLRLGRPPCYRLGLFFLNLRLRRFPGLGFLCF